MKNVIYLCFALLTTSAIADVVELSLKQIGVIDNKEELSDLPSSYTIIKDTSDPRLGNIEKLFDIELSNYLKESFIIFNSGNPLGRSLEGIRKGETWVFFEDTEEVYPFDPMKLSLYLIPKTENHIFIVVKFREELWQNSSPDQDSME